MTVFDQFYFNVFNHYKARYKRRANTLAVFYISFLQLSIILVLGVFFAAFFNQMNVDTISSQKAWTLFIITSFILYFKNWIQYSGRKRSVMNAKLNRNKSRQYNIWLLWLLPICCITLSIILLQVL